MLNLDESNKLIGRQEIADFLNVSPVTLSRRLKKPNPPPVYRPFNRIEADKDELTAWRREQKVT